MRLADDLLQIVRRDGCSAAATDSANSAATTTDGDRRRNTAEDSMRENLPRTDAKDGCARAGTFTMVGN